MFVSTILFIGILLVGTISFWHGIFPDSSPDLCLYRSYRLSLTSEAVFDKGVEEVSDEVAQEKSIKWLILYY